jgi:hypothetical protein
MLVFINRASKKVDNEICLLSFQNLIRRAPLTIYKRIGFVHVNEIVWMKTEIQFYKSLIRFRLALMSFIFSYSEGSRSIALDIHIIRLCS